MRRRFWYWAMALAVAGFLAAGCRVGTARVKDGPKAGAAIQKAKERREDPTQRLAEAHAHYGAGVVHEMNGETDEALDEYYQAALKDPANETVVLDVSRRLIQSKQLEKGVELLNRAAAQEGASGEIFGRLGVIYSQLGKFEESAAASRMAIKKSPASLVGYQTLLLNHLHNKAPNEALKVLDEASGQPNAKPEFLMGVAELYRTLGVQVPAQKKTADEKALAVLNRVAKTRPASPPLQLELADGFDALGETTKAAELYLELLKTLPDAPGVRERVHAKLTDLYLKSENHKGAIEQLEAIIRDDPTNPQAYYFLGRLAYEEKRLPDAIDYFSKTLVLREDFEQAYYDLALAQIGTNKTSEALTTLEKARGKFAQNFVLEFLSGLAFGRQKAYTEALQHFTAAEVVGQATEPKRLTEDFYFQVGATYERKGDYEQAEKYFRKTLELAPNFSEAQNYLGFMWAEHGMKLDEARALIEKALLAEPKNAAYLDSMAWVFYKLNQPQKALEYMLKAVELLEAPDATVLDHLGDVYAALGKRDKAREAWQKSLTLEASEPVKKKLEEGGK